MRIATWNVNSLKARIEKVWWWLERAQPDVLLMQETKLTDRDAPHAAFREHGYELVHHGEGRWNGVAIASRSALSNVVTNTNFGEEDPPPPAAETPANAGDSEPAREARMIAATTNGIRVISIYAPNGRTLGSTFYEAKLKWFARLSHWLRTCGASDERVLGGDFNVAPDDIDVWDPRACHGGTHVSPAERAAFAELCASGLVDAYRLHHAERDRYTWWDYRAGNFPKNLGMRIDHLLVGTSLSKRVVWAEIDREARKGKPIPSDHAPLLLDLDAPGKLIDAGWAAAAGRIAGRRR